MSPQEILKRRQEIGDDVEHKMIEFLMQYGPARDLKISDAKEIARTARAYAFDSTQKLFD
jgi:hypothetical protein